MCVRVYVCVFNQYTFILKGSHTWISVKFKYPENKTTLLNYIQIIMCKPSQGLTQAIACCSAGGCRPCFFKVEVLLYQLNLRAWRNPLFLAIHLRMKAHLLSTRFCARPNVTSRVLPPSVPSSGCLSHAAVSWVTNICSLFSEQAF